MQVTAAIAACRDADGTSLYPDGDWPLFRAALADVDIEPARVAWDDPAVAWEAFDIVVVSSTWDSVDRPAEFLDWASAVGDTTTLVNPAGVLAWNLDKRYLLELEAAGIPVVPTTWIGPGDDWLAPSTPFVVKPTVSAGGRETARYGADDGAAADHVERLLQSGRTAMVQPYLAGIDAPGELKMTFIDGEFSHAVRVGPLLEAGAGVIERPWEKPVAVDVAAPSVGDLDLAHAVMTHAANRFGHDPLYGRVDVADVGPGRPVLLELELIDPVLSLWAEPGAPRRLAAAISTAMRS